MEVFVCPVCRGTGKKELGFYGAEGKCPTLVNCSYPNQESEECRSCHGDGYVEVPKEKK